VIKNIRIRLEGQTVLLVPMEESHRVGLWAAAEPEEIWQFMATRIRSSEEMDRTVAEAIAEKEKGTQIPFTIIRKRDAAIIGSTRYLDISLRNESLEIGWTWLNPSAWRTSINTECKYLLLKYAFEELGMNRVLLKTDDRNNRSQKAIERLGAVREGVLRMDRKLADGYIRDTVMYSILASEWQDVKLKLEKILEDQAY
jgi:N-acetyltransferase